MVGRTVKTVALLGAVAAFGLQSANAAFMTPNASDGSPTRVDNSTLAVWDDANPNFLVGSWQPGDANGELVFLLPTLAAGESFATATLIAKCTESDNYGWGWNVDLYGLAARAASPLLASDYYSGALDTTPGISLIMDNYIAAGNQANGTSYTASGTPLVDYLNAQYAGGANAGKYVFLRMSQDVAYDLPNDRIFKIGSATNGSSGIPSLEYTVAAVPEPASLGLLGLMSVGLLIQRRRKA